MPARLRAAVGAVERVGYGLCAALLTGMTLIAGWQVFSRRVFGFTPPWAEELPRYAMVWLGLVGAALGLRRGSHLAVEFVVRKLGPRAARGIAALVWAVEAIFAAAMVWYGVGVARYFMSETSPATRIPVGLIYLAVPVSGLLMLLFLAEQAAGARAARKP